MFADVSTWNETLAIPSDATVQVSVLLVTVQPGVAVAHASPPESAGSTSVTTTLVAAAGPAFVTVTSNPTVLLAAPYVTVALVADFDSVTFGHWMVALTCWDGLLCGTVPPTTGTSNVAVAVLVIVPHVADEGSGATVLGAAVTVTE